MRNDTLARGLFHEQVPETRLHRVQRRFEGQQLAAERRVAGLIAGSRSQDSSVGSRKGSSRVPLVTTRGGTSNGVRLISGTTVSLLDRIAAGTFSEQLFYRLNIIHLTVASARHYSRDSHGSQS